jgi:hypothetical protein
LIIGRQLLTLLAFIVRIEGQAAVNKTTAQHITFRRCALRRNCRQGQGVSIVNLQIPGAVSL